MNYYVNVDEVFEHVKIVCDINRCNICDKLDGTRLRYSCGHSVCHQCAALEDCMQCLSPSSSTTCTPYFDAILTERVKHATVLLETCQEAFHTDAYKRKRLSEQLKIEKELFPECIQAPAKYCNKRKSLLSSSRFKENKEIPYLPGEDISSPQDRNMENSTNYVRDWLIKNEKNLVRKPFMDLSTNKQINHTIQYPGKRTIKKPAKTNSFKCLKSAKCSLKNKFNDENMPRDEPCAKKRKQFEKPYSVQTLKKSINDESGIVIDDEPILIEDSQSEFIDKDREACLAVLAAEENTQDDSGSEITLECRGIVDYTTPDQKFVKEPMDSIYNKCAKIPFYKKSYILETCSLCQNVIDSRHKKSVNTIEQSDDISITVESQSFITTIKVYKAEEVLRNKQSVEIQTDNIDDASNISGDLVKRSVIDNDCNEKQAHPPVLVGCSKISQNVFTELTDQGSQDKKTNKYNNVSAMSQKTGSKCIVIEESESEIDSDSGPVEVTADIHRSCDHLDYGILNEVVDAGEHESRPRRGPRGLTPTSTDSSEKENFNPNRIKKTKTGKKTKKKNFK